MDATPKIPTLKDSKKPQVKVRGLGAGLNLAERLKQFKKKDLAFILAGLGVLFMAPLAEHFMMAPEGGDGTLKPGWSGPGSSGSGSLGGGGSPYERTDGLAPGGPTGGGADIITPLNVRDPSSLIMGPSAAQQPPTNSALAGTPPGPPPRSDADLKDALAASARGLGAAAKKAPMPLPKVALGGSGLRGLGVAGGGSSASAGLGGISAANVPNKASMADSTGNARPTKGYSGVARGQTQGGSGVEALKAAASKQGEGFNRSGSAASDLNAAAQTAIPAGGAGGAAGGPSGGKDDKGFGGNQDKGSKTVGESLAFLEKKSRMEKDLELEYKKKEKNDWELIGADLRNDFLKTMVSKGMAEPIAGAMGDMLKGLMTESGGPSTYSCAPEAPNTPPVVVQAKTVGICGGKEGSGIQWEKGAKSSGGGVNLKRCGEPRTLLNCIPDKPGKDEKENGEKLTEYSVTSGLSKVCGDITEELGQTINNQGVPEFVGGLKNNADEINAAQVALIGGGVPKGCQSSTSQGPSASSQLKASIDLFKGVLDQVVGLVDQAEGTLPNTNDANKQLASAANAIDAVKVDGKIAPPPPSIVKNTVTDAFVTKIKYGQDHVVAEKSNLGNIGKAVSEQIIEINRMIGEEGTLKQVMAENSRFNDKIKSKFPRIAIPETREQQAGEGETHNAITEANNAITEVIKKLEPGRALETADPLSPPKTSLTLAPASKDSLEVQVSNAVKKIAAMRAAQTGWASAVKKVLQEQKALVEAEEKKAIASTN